MNSNFAEKIAKSLVKAREFYAIISERIKSAKIKESTEQIWNRIKRVITDIRIEKLSKLSKRSIIIMGSSALAIIVFCGAFALLGPDKSGGQEKPLVASAQDAESEEEIPVIYYAIQIDGKEIVGLATEEEAQSVMDDVAKHYSTDGAELVGYTFNENVEIIEKEAVEPELSDVTGAKTMILTGTKEPKVYTVADGDCLWDIAVKNGMGVDDLITSNPDADIDHLKIGSTLNLYELKPYVHVTLTERVAKTENIDYDIVYEETNTLYKGEVKVKTAGVYGKREVKSEVVKENGTVVSATEIASTVVSQPSTQVNLKGTKSLATLVGSGSFVSPMGSLEVSSAYGSRGGGRHTGVDLRNPKGTPIYAVDDGVVTASAYRGSYGNIVQISHGNGLETWYAHCDSLLVSKGAVVKKGQQIATVGITGRATGYHLHFEVRKNGTPQNPMNYL